MQRNNPIVGLANKKKSDSAIGKMNVPESPQAQGEKNIKKNPTDFFRKANRIVSVGKHLVLPFIYIRLNPFFVRQPLAHTHVFCR